MTVDESVRPVPLELVEGFAKVWVELQGGHYRTVSVDGGALVVWTRQDGREFGLPDRMYGLADYRLGTYTSPLPGACVLNLPPGVKSDRGKVVCETHLLRAENVEQAWNCLKRVGRQGVRKAEATGCSVVKLRDDQYLELSCLKNSRLGSPAPSPRFVGLLRQHLGTDNVGITGVEIGGVPIAGVLWTVIQGYGFLIDGASDPKHWPKNPNNLAVWSAIVEAFSKEMDVIDFGFSPVGSGDGRFKKNMGGTCVPLFQV